MTTYCLTQDVIDRLSLVGCLYCCDDDNDGVLSPDEEALIDDAISACSAEIDGSLTPVIESVPIQQTAANLNRWLRDRCVDLTCERLVGRKGRKVIAAVKDAATRSREWLKSVADKEMRVPGLAYPGDGFSNERMMIGRPVVGRP